MADSLHARYMAATSTWRAHLKGCTTCQHGDPCRTGRPLFERFCRLQDAYLNKQRS